MFLPCRGGRRWAPASGRACGSGHRLGCGCLFLSRLPRLRGLLRPRGHSCRAGARHRTCRFGDRVRACRGLFLPCRGRRMTTGLTCGAAGGRPIPAMPYPAGGLPHAVGALCGAPGLRIAGHRPRGCGKHRWRPGYRRRFRGTIRACLRCFGGVRRSCLPGCKPCGCRRLLSGGALQGCRLAVLRCGASGLSALGHGDIVLLTGCHPAVRSAFLYLLRGNRSEACGLGRCFSCCAGC